MNAWPDELRLIFVIVTNGLMLAAAWRVARRSTFRAAIALPDTILYWLAAQYVIVGGCGMLGVLWPGLTLSIASVVSVAVLLRTPSPRRSVRSRQEDRILWMGLAFVVGYAAAFIAYQRWNPEMATDPLVYHVPAAAHWIQDGRISLVDFWYWLPANTYSPLAGSVWIAWWLGPIGNDVLSRFVQLPTWLLLFAAAIRLMRDLRVSIAAACIVATAILLSRSFITQVIIAKDDIAVAALAITLLGGLHPRRLGERASPYRLGIAFGLLISLKYPAILALTIAAPAIVGLGWWRSLRVRGTAIAGAISIAFVVPWLIRNAIVTGGNPFYPFFSGGGGFIPDPTLRSGEGIYSMLALRSFAPPLSLWIAMVVSIVILLIVRRRRVVANDGILLSLLLGPPLTIVLLIATFPWPEVRYLFSAIAAWMLLPGVAFATIRLRWIGIAVACVLVSFAFGTSYLGERLVTAAGFLPIAFAAAAIAFVTHTTLPRMTSTARLWLACGASAVLLVSIYIWWNAFLRNPNAGYAQGSEIGWQIKYPDVGPMWTLVRERVPADATIAYVNTPTTWPLFGFDLQHRIVYAPVRPGVTHLHDLPPIRERVPAQDEYIAATRQLNDGADVATWIANLDRLKVDYLFIVKRESSNDPPELRFIAAHRDRFEGVAENEAVIVLRYRR